MLDDGGEVDLDLGNYERYLNITLSRDQNITTGKIYQHVIERERRGDYLGKTVQIVPHLTDAIQDWIERVARVPVDDSGREPDVCIVEVSYFYLGVHCYALIFESAGWHCWRHRECSVHRSHEPASKTSGNEKLPSNSCQLYSSDRLRAEYVFFENCFQITEANALQRQNRRKGQSVMSEVLV